MIYNAVMPPKDADRMTNSEDTDQTAPSGAVCSGSALFAQTHMSHYIAVTFENLVFNP